MLAAGERLDFQATVEEAWTNPRHTTFELPAIDVNRLLAERYTVDPPLAFTREMLWDVEVKKASQPDRYMPGVVQDGSAQAWGRRQQSDGTECFFRASVQRMWRNPAEFGLVLEQTQLDHRAQKVTFIGVSELEDGHGQILKAGRRQPLFHAQHWVIGDPERPLSAGRIVHLTDRPDSELIGVLTHIAQQPWLPEFHEIYLARDAGAKLVRRQ
jgi:hypothetical protein